MSLEGGGRAEALCCWTKPGAKAARTPEGVAWFAGADGAEAW